MKTLNNTQVNHPPSLEKLINTQSRGMFKRRWIWLAGAIVLLLISGILFIRTENNSIAFHYNTEPVEVGTLIVTVSATGNLEPTNQVEVGSELSGIVEQVFVDVNDIVKKDQVLALLDRSKLKDAVTKSKANLEAAEAQVKLAGATVEEARATLGRYREVSQLSGGKVPSKNEMDIAEATLKRAEAEKASKLATVAQAQANLQTDKTNFEKASILSPINGMVLSREVDPGQTVAASFQAPVLFIIAEDLSQMELQVDVDEADVGQIKEGQKATFTVDAWTDRQYEAIITRVNYGSQVKDGVVSYLTVLSVDNSDLSLRPGMTGTADITTLTRERVLLVPNAALRFTPASISKQPKKSGGGIVGSLLPRPPAQERKGKQDANGTSRVWILQDGQSMSVEVKTGATDGRMTEIVDGTLKAGMQVITESQTGN